MFGYEEERRRKEEDDVLALVLQWTSQGKRPEWQVVARLKPEVKTYLSQWDSLLIRNGLLYRHWKNADGTVVKEKLVVPETLKEEVLKS